MTPKEETAYRDGQRSVLRRQLAAILRELGYDGPEQTEHGWIEEREAAVAKLRSVCSEHGDNEWPDELHLADVIDKHLARHLEQQSGKTPSRS
jgi:hypothetical protein